MKKLLSLFMSLVMLLTVTAGLNLTAYAEPIPALAVKMLHIPLIQQQVFLPFQVQALWLIILLIIVRFIIIVI